MPYLSPMNISLLNFSLMKNKWVLGARPKTLPAALSPILLGTGLGIHEFGKINLLNFILTLVIGLGLQIAVNYANDYSDGIKGSDANRVGPVRLVASGLAEAKAVKRAAFIAIAISSLAGLYFAQRTTYWFLLVGALAIIATWGYTGGEKPYGYRGFGEISVFIFFGLVATIGTYYGQCKEITLVSFWAASAMGFFSCAILMANNIRDIPTDREVGKKTLAVRVGDSTARWLNIIFLLLPLASSVLMGVKEPWYLFALVFLIPIFRLIRIVRSKAVGKDLIALLAGVGKVQLAFAALLSLIAIVTKK